MAVTVRTVPITPSMTAIMQTLANNVIAARRDLARAEEQFNNYIAQCRDLTVGNIRCEFNADKQEFIVTEEVQQQQQVSSTETETENAYHD